MNITSGGLSFDFTATNDQLKKIIQQSKDEIKGLADASQQGGKVMDAAFKSAFSRLDQHADMVEGAMSKSRQAIMKLEAEILKLKKDAETAYSSGDKTQSTEIMKTVIAREQELKAHKNQIRACEDAYTAIDGERTRLEALRGAADEAATSQESLRSRLRHCREELAQMEATQGIGVRQTQAFRDLQQEAGALADALSDAQAQVRVFSDDNANITGALEGMNMLAGGFSAAQGAMSLFGVENDKVQEAMLKVQSAIAITTGLQQVANAVNKDSAFMLVIVRKAKDLLAASTNKLTVALGGSAIAAKALMATLTLGLSVAIGALIYLWDRYTSKSKEAAAQTDDTRKAFEAFHQSTAAKSAELVGKYQKLCQEYAKLKTVAEKTKWIKDNAQAMDDLGLAVDGVTSADRIFVGNTAAVVKALELRAKAMALQEMQMKAYEEYYNRVIRADSTVAGGGYFAKVGEVIAPGSQAAKDLSEAMKEAGAVTKNGDAYNDGSWYSMKGGDMVLTQKAIDHVNAYRLKEAKKTNRKIHAEAQTELDKTVNYTKKQLELTQKQIDDLNVLKSGGSKSSSGRTGKGKTETKSETEKFKTELATRKGLYDEYYKWVTSSEESVRQAAAQEFAPLLEQGSSYLDYLKRQEEALSGVTETKAVKEKLKIIRNEIAEATKEATLRDFQRQLEADLSACQTLGAMLDKIEERRKALQNDDSEEVTKQREILDSKKADVQQQVKEETQELLRTYASYELERYQFARTYARKRELLERQLKEAQTEEEKDVAAFALKNLEEENNKWSKSKTSLYAELLEKYKTTQQKLADIQKKYAKEREEAAKENNISILQLIEKEEQEEISKLASAQLMASQTWNELFSDIDKLGTKAIERLIKQIEAHRLTLSAELSPADLKAVEDQLERAREVVRQRNPFLALRDSLGELRRAMSEKKLLSDTKDPILQKLEEKKKEYETIAASLADPTTAGSVAVDFKTTLEGGADFKTYLRNRIKELEGQKVKLGVEFTGQHELDVLIAMLNKVQGTGKSVGQGFKETFGEVGSTIQFIAGTFDAVIGGMKKMGIQMDEETEAILGDIGGIMEGAQGLSEGIASGNPLAIIQGSITLFSSAFDLFNSRDRKAQASIEKHEKTLSNLKNTYNELQHAIKKALGEETYTKQSALIANLRRQQQEVNAMMGDELGKKNSDSEKVEQYREQFKEIGRQISDITDEITASITQTTAKDLAGQLADALVEAFEGGEEAAKAFGEVADDVIKKAVLNALKLQILEKPLQNAIKQLQRDMGFDEEGNGTFNGLSDGEQKRFKAAVEAAGANFKAAMDMYEGLFEQLDDSDPTTLSGAIKGASQESIDLLAGQTNAVRQNQVITIALFRQQLLHLSNIDSNTGVIAGRLLTILNHLTTPQGSSLRSQGITD